MSANKKNDLFLEAMEKLAATKKLNVVFKLLSWLDAHPKTAFGLGGVAGTVTGLEGLDRLAGGSGVLTSRLKGEKHNPNWFQRTGYAIGRDLGKINLLPDTIGSAFGNYAATKNLTKSLKEIDKRDKAVKSTWRPLYS